MATPALAKGEKKNALAVMMAAAKNSGKGVPNSDDGGPARARVNAADVRALTCAVLTRTHKKSMKAGINDRVEQADGKTVDAARDITYAGGVRYKDKDIAYDISTGFLTLEQADDEPAGWGRQPRGCLGCTRSILSEIYLCHACSCHEMW